MAKSSGSKRKPPEDAIVRQRPHPLVFDGLNCAKLDAAQMRTMLRGHVSAMNWTAIRPSARLAQALLDLEAA